MSQLTGSHQFLIWRFLIFLLLLTKHNWILSEEEKQHLPAIYQQADACQQIGERVQESANNLCVC